MQIAPILTIVYARVQNQNALFTINLLDFCLLLSYSIENFCKDMHFFSIDQKIWHFFIKISQYFKDRFRLGKPNVGGSGAALVGVWLSPIGYWLLAIGRSFGAIALSPHRLIAAELRILYCRPRAGSRIGQ